MRSVSGTLVLFDDHCRVCSASVDLVERYNRDGRLQCMPIQSVHGRKLYENEGLDADDIQTFVLIKNGKAYFRSDAVIEAANALGGFWRCFKVFRILPRPLRDGVYACFAKNRYRWFGRRGV